MRKTLAAAAVVGATLGGAGLALAQSGPPDSTPPVEAPPTDPPEGTPVGPPESTPPVERPDTVAAEEADDLEAIEIEAEESTTAEHPDNHGAAVSTAAHECPEGEGHGECVSAVARDMDEDGTPDHGPGSADFNGQQDSDDGEG
jgi:hypothetical protein